MSTDTITLSRAIVAALVDPKDRNYIQRDDRDAWCAYCGESTWITGDQHTADCPVRIVQEALGRT